MANDLLLLETGGTDNLLLESHATDDDLLLESATPGGGGAVLEWRSSQAWHRSYTSP